MKKVEKKEIIEKLRSGVLKAKSIFLTEYKGMNFVELSELRKSLKSKSGEFHVAKNTLLKLALKDTPNEQLTKFLDGQNSVVFAFGDGVEVAKVLTDAARKFSNLKLKACYFEGQVYDANGIQKLSLLPSQRELRATLLRTLAGPLGGLVRVLGGPIRGMVTVLNEISKKKAA